MNSLGSDNVGSGAIRIVPYDPDWPSTFRQIEADLAEQLGCLLGSVDHVGSTSVPGLAAKPKIDVDAVVISDERLAAAVDAMRSAPDWTFHGTPYGDGMWTFTRGRGSWGARLYLCAPGNPVHTKRILFRDWLRTHADDARAYEVMKRRLSVETDGDWNAYTCGKSGFVADIVARAEAQQGENRCPTSQR